MHALWPSESVLFSSSPLHCWPFPCPSSEVALDPLLPFSTRHPPYPCTATSAATSTSSSAAQQQPGSRRFPRIQSDVYDKDDGDGLEYLCKVSRSSAHGHRHRHTERRRLEVLKAIRETEAMLNEVAFRRKRILQGALEDELLPVNSGGNELWSPRVSWRRLLLPASTTSGLQPRRAVVALAWLAVLLVVSCVTFAVEVAALSALDWLGVYLPRASPQERFRSTCLARDGPLGWNVSTPLSCASDPVLGFWAGHACERCQSGWYGKGCSVLCVASMHCSGHGSCGTDGRCLCAWGWKGSSCNVSAINSFRQRDLREAFLESWEAYRAHAWGHDLLRPISKGALDWVPGGLGLTLVDALDSLWLIGAHEEFAEAKQWVRSSLNFDIDAYVSVFETTIRVLGGLLAAYTYDNDYVFVERARELADRLLPSFQHSACGVPYSHINLKTGHCRGNDWAPASAILAELGSVQLEFRYLSHLTQNPVYDLAVTRVMDVMERAQPTHGLFPLYFQLDTGTFLHDTVSFGAMGDSFYEYLLKQHLLTNEREPRYLRMYNASVKGLLNELLVVTPKFSYVSERVNGGLNHRMDHLACFVPGMLALGAGTDGAILATAELLAATCVQMYLQSPTGIGPEGVTFTNLSMAASPKYYHLRPEVIESLFYLWRFTKKPVYREWGWTLFENIRRWCHVPSGGYSGLRDVTQVPPTMDDRMESFWLAETLKYLFLLFSDDSALDLDQFVLNTEGHRLPKFPSTSP
eukprot:RCo042731